MPCYQSTNLPSGFTTTGRTSYRTEAECLNACKEGACCEGTTCSVKPQCQCQGTGKTFKGVGTVCTPNPCLCCNANGTPKSGSVCQACWCFCGEGAAAYPRFINVSLSGTYKMFRPNVFQEGGREWKTKSFSCSVTLSALSAPSRSNCPNWHYGNGDSLLPLGADGARGHVFIDAPFFVSPTSTQFGVSVVVSDLSEFSVYQDWRTSGRYLCGSRLPIMSAGTQTSGTCFSDIAVSFRATPNPLAAGIPEDEEFAVIDGSIEGVQA